MNKAADEARHLVDTLQSLGAGSVYGAELVWIALSSEPDRDALLGALLVLELVEDSLPRGPLAGFARARIKRLYTMMRAMLDGPPSPFA